MTTKKATQNNTVVAFTELLANAHKLSEGEKIQAVDRKYTAVTDKDNLTVKVTLELPLKEVMKSAKGKNYIIPVGNVQGARGGNVIEAYTDDGLIVKIYADRAYISSEVQENEKKLANNNKANSEKALLKDQNAKLEEQNKMLMALLQEKGLL